MNAGLKQWLLPVTLFALALLVRVIGLSGFLTADEPLWIDRSRHFAGGLLLADYTCPSTDRGREFAGQGLSCTLQSEHPGVTTMWGGSLGLLAYYWQVVRPAGTDLRTFLTSIDMGELDPALIVPVRLPLAVTGALFVLCFYLLLRRLLNERLALVAALLVALHPFHITLSRMLHHDGLTTAFMILSALTMIGYWLRGWRGSWLLLSGVLAGLAFLSKPASWFMLPYLGVVAGLGLYYRRSGTLRLKVLSGAGLSWGVAAGLTCLAFFPALWTIPGEVFRVVFSQSLEAAGDGHRLYFLGQVSDDPGPLFYPLSWLLQATPLEVIGLLSLPVAVWRAGWLRSSASLRRQLANRPVEVALALFAILFLLFTTLSAKKLARYFLPAFPVIDIFVAFGLLWLMDSLTADGRLATAANYLVNTLFNRQWSPAGGRTGSPNSNGLGGLAPRWALPALVGLILIGQGGPALAHAPYYFTYYNPLLGGPAGAAQLTTMSFGEGANEAAAYLNQQPEAESLQVAVCGNDDLFSPFFVGEVHHCTEPEILQADYVVYYLKVGQMERDKTTWPYFANHYTPVHRVSLHGLDYISIYRSPLVYAAASPDNSLPNVLTAFGYNLAADGKLTLFWQNFGLGEKQLMAGLAPPLETGAPQWVTCRPAPGFTTEAQTLGAILESECLLGAAAGLSTGLYDLQLGLGDGLNITPLTSSSLALLAFDQTAGQFERVDPAVALAELAELALPAEATPLDIAYGDRLRLVGYQLEPAVWQPSQPGQIVLYWQPIRRPDFGLASAIQLVLRLSADQGHEPVLTVTQPMLPGSVTRREWARGAVTPVHYPLSLPATASPGEYALDVCLAIASNGQLLPGVMASTDQPIECLPLAVTVNHL